MRRKVFFFQEKVCFSDQSSHRDTWSHSKMTLLTWIIFTLGELGVPVDQREDCLDHLGNHLRPYITIRLHRHNIFKRGLIAVFKELFRILSSSDLQSPWVIPREPTTSSFSNSPGNWFTPRKVDNHFIFICWKLSLIYPFVLKIIIMLKNIIKFYHFVSGRLFCKHYSKNRWHKPIKVCFKHSIYQDLLSFLSSEISVSRGVTMLLDLIRYKSS